MILQVTPDIVNNTVVQYGFLGLLAIFAFFVIKYLVSQNTKQTEQAQKDKIELSSEFKELNEHYLSHLQTTENNLLKIIEKNTSVIDKFNELSREHNEIMRQFISILQTSNFCKK